MKINHKNIQRLYQAYVMEKTSISRKDCPSPKQIVNLFRFKNSKRQKTKILDHIGHCYYCTQEFKYILATLRHEREIKHAINNLLTLKKEKNNTKGILKKLSFSRLSWKYASIVTGIIFFVSVFSIISVKFSEKLEYRGTYSPQIKLTEPINKTYSKSSLIFKWNKIKNSDHCILEIFSDSLYPVWKSNKIFNNQIVLPEKISKNLKNTSYFWMITAFLPNGEEVESRIEKFIVKE